MYKISIFLTIFILMILSTSVQCITRELPTTTVTGEITQDGHIYTLINNYGVWASIIIYGLFWLMIFVGFLIPFEKNMEFYSPLAVPSNKINMEMAAAKLESPMTHVDMNAKDAVMEHHHDLHDVSSLIYMKVLKISPLYSILHSRSYGDCTKKIALFILNVMTIIMFMAILYNSARFDVIAKNEMALGISIIAVMISWGCKYLYGFIKQMLMGRSITQQNFMFRNIFFWALFQAIFWGLAIVISYEMSFQNIESSNLWVASIFIGIIFELIVFDLLAMLIANMLALPKRSIWCIMKFNGYC